MSEEARPRASGRRPGAAARSLLRTVVAVLRKPVLRRTWPPAWQLVAAELLGGVFSLAYTGPMLPEIAPLEPQAAKLSVLPMRPPKPIPAADPYAGLIVIARASAVPMGAEPDRLHDLAS